MTDEREREVLIEAVVSAWRPRSKAGAVQGHPSWHDLDEAGRVEAARVAAVSRRMEAALDPEGLSSTARAVLARIRGATG